MKGAAHWLSLQLRLPVIRSSGTTIQYMYRTYQPGFFISFRERVEWEWEIWTGGLYFESKRLEKKV